MTIYDGFNDWQDVANNFYKGYVYDEKDAQEALKAIPEPEEVIVAAYSCESYEGSAYVVYRNGNKFYSVEGGHCSCYGLEDQWNPEEYDAVTFLAVLEQSSPWGAAREYKQAVMGRVRAFIMGHL